MKDDADLARWFAEAAGAPADAFTVPFQDAIAYHRQKVNLPTLTSADIDGQMHDRAFVVAGVVRDDLLSDLNKAVDDAIAKGETLETFTQKFEEAAAKAGWLQDKSGKVRAWRARIVYETNLRVAHQAGRLKQMTDPAVVATRPYWQYVHADTREPKTPRPMHLSWDGLVLAWDDPWWRTHFPPNGWLCSCGVRTLSKREMGRKGLSVGDAPQDGLQSYVDPATGEVAKVPNGIDPGWDHQPGAAWLDEFAPQQATGAPKQFVEGSPEGAGARVETDAAGAPLVIAASSFDGLNPRERDLVLKALRDPDEIALAFVPAAPRKILTRFYRRGSVEVRWARSAWSWSRDGAPTPATVIWSRAA